MGLTGGKRGIGAAVLTGVVIAIVIGGSESY